jgi:hypothetical protein
MCEVNCGLGPPCTAGQTCCPDSTLICVDTMNDPRNCGACGNICYWSTLMLCNHGACI